MASNDPIHDILQNLLGKWVVVEIRIGSIVSTHQGELWWNYFSKQYSINSKDGGVIFESYDVQRNNDFDGNTIRLITS